MTPELTWVCRAGLGEANVCSLFQLLLSEMKREQVQESFTGRPTEPHSTSLRFNHTQLKPGVVGNYTVACPLMTVQLSAHRTDHSRRTHWFFSDDSNNYTLKMNRWVEQETLMTLLFLMLMHRAHSSFHQTPHQRPLSTVRAFQTGCQTAGDATDVTTLFWSVTVAQLNWKQWTLQMSWSNNHCQRMSQVVQYNSIEQICTFRGFFSIKLSKRERESFLFISSRISFRLSLAFYILPPGIKTVYWSTTSRCLTQKHFTL